MAVAPGTLIRFSVAGQAGGWSPFAYSTPAQLREGIVTALLTRGYDPIVVDVQAAADASIVLHQFPFRASITVRTGAVAASMNVAKSDVRDAVESVARQTVTISNVTAGEQEQAAPRSLIPSLPALTGFVAVAVVGLVVFAVILREVT